MHTLKTRTRFALCALATLLASCDPGYRLPPVGWQCASSGLWGTTFPDFHLDYVEASGLIGETWLHLKFQMSENSQAYRIDSASLQSSAGQFLPEKPFHVQHLPVGGGAFQVSWWFNRDEPVFRVLRDTTAVTLYFNSASGPRNVTIRYVWNQDLHKACGLTSA
jgi:hypothetical protein